MTRRSWNGIATLLILAVAPLCRLDGQSDSRLQAAVRLSQDGLSDSARAVVGRLLAATAQTDSLYPELLYTMGLVASTEQDRRLYFRRVVVDFLQSVWADDALLQLAQLDYSSGNTEATVRQVEQLLRDYPDSPLTAQAAFWGGRAAGDRRDGGAACRMADAGLAAVGEDVELKNLLDFQKQRCQGLAALAAESVQRAVADSIERARTDSILRATPPKPSHPASTAPGRAGAGIYVQTSAVKTQAAANAEIARIKRAGYSAVTMKEGGFLKIRSGPFRTRGEAAAAAADLAKKLGGRPFVVSVP